MNTLESYVAVAVTLLFLAGAGLLVMGVREARRVRKQWNGRA